jgi:hypothetical protein
MTETGLSADVTVKSVAKKQSHTARFTTPTRFLKVTSDKASTSAFWCSWIVGSLTPEVPKSGYEGQSGERGVRLSSRRGPPEDLYNPEPCVPTPTTGRSREQGGSAENNIMKGKRSFCRHRRMRQESTGGKR